MSTTEIILSDFTERCEGGTFGQVNGIEKNKAMVSSVSRNFPKLVSKNCKNPVFNTQLRLLLKLILGSNKYVFMHQFALYTSRPRI